MKHISLATRYRPQRFDEIAGQDLIKAVLSRASAEDRVASGYLLSGTRGVGKTTIARIFAKALNCEHAPCAEPCNTCDSCRRVTAGSHPDVIEMDGASNNTVDDARALRETVGFAPMEGRYKIFIIDEAHMLTRNAFNALLKTLEEPPPHVVFIFATTELFRFPPTILSRCQIFSFRHLSDDTITRHLAHVLEKENVPFEEPALRLIARRAAGSARDSMSLLDQILAYGSEQLTSENVRAVLGLAGFEAMQRLFECLARGDCGAVALFTRDLVSREIDISFFLRELTDNVRSLFLLHQCDRETVSRLGVSDNELDALSALAPMFTPTWLHAAWQMILDNMRPVAGSQEPAAALELMLINLALLPRLLPAQLVESARAAQPPVTGEEQPPRTTPAAAPQDRKPPAPSASVAASPPVEERITSPAQTAPENKTADRGFIPVQDAKKATPSDIRRESPDETAHEDRQTAFSPAADTRHDDQKDAAPQPAPEEPAAEPPQAHSLPDDADDDDELDTAMAPAHEPVAPGSGRPLEVKAFHVWLQKTGASVPAYLVSDLRIADEGPGVITFEVDGQTILNTLVRSRKELEAALSAYLGRPVTVEFHLSRRASEAAAAHAPRNYDRPELKHVLEILNARVDRIQRNS